MQVLNFLFSRVFWLLHSIFKMKKNLFVPINLIIINVLYKKTSILIIASFMFFGGKTKTVKTLFK